MLSNAVYLELYLDLWARKCCIVICILIVNAILVVQRRIDWSSHRRVFIKKSAPTHFSKFTGKHMCKSLFFKRLYYKFFPMNFPRFVRPLFLQNTLRRLLLYLEPFQISMIELFCRNTEAVVQRCFVSFEVSQNSQENTCSRVLFLTKLQASVKFLRAPFLKEHHWSLLLEIVSR